MLLQVFNTGFDNLIPSVDHTLSCRSLSSYMILCQDHSAWSNRAVIVICSSPSRELAHELRL